jgi:hypothetical protein
MSLQSEIVALITAIGADIKSLNTNKVSIVAGKGLSTLTKEYVSAETTIPANGTASLTHGLGAIPKSLFLSLVCKTAELGFVAGEEAIIGSVFTGVDAGTNIGIQTACTSTTIRVKVATVGVALMNMTTGVPAVVNPTNWRLIVRAYA